MSEDPRPIDMNRCGEWNSAGIELWNVVDRSWSVYARNTMELIEFLKAPMRDPAILSMVMTDGPAESSTLWDELAQRLQNQIAVRLNAAGLGLAGRIDTGRSARGCDSPNS